MSNNGLLKSSLAKKYLMALTGLFLCTFLVGHLAGNLQLFIQGAEGQQAFNEYAEFMTTFPLVKLLSYLTYACVLFHIVDGIVLTTRNRKSRPVGYVKERGSANASWASRNMGVLGTIIAVFLVSHMQTFWYKMHFGEMPMHDGLKDLHTVVLAFFSPENSLGIVAVLGYVLAQMALAFHLVHGFQSGFQSLGLRHPKYTPAIEKTGYLFGIGVPLLFAIIPVFLYITQL
ncbi:MAG: succinate dehydrogenase cytochrome b subunit [Flavobacteriales bacterium]|jgi:succinate dehydrogenase / fumarate reductase cytochrome b subunit|nr:succinate dehydrogenase cytochrome b subunit [Flavobacteriales bacterium]MDB4694637.1 succinate dehydrogenase cytochrome b subunit [Flavobacteriales bacterium]